MSGEDYYAILGVRRDATDEEIKRNYRKLSLRYHPDKNNANENVEECTRQFQLISEGYQVLSDKEKRAAYDQYGSAGLRQGFTDRQGNYHSGFSFKDAFHVFKEFFGGRNPFAELFGQDTNVDVRSKTPVKPAPLVKDLELSLEELYLGTVKKIKVERSGATDSAPTVKTYTLEVKPGWKRDTKITYPNEGDVAPGSQVAGDLVFIVKEKPHERFVRNGDDLEMAVNVPLYKALTGFTVEVTTLDERQINIPIVEIVSPYNSKVVPNEGMPISKKPGEKGSLILKFVVEFPSSALSEEQKALITKALGSN